MADTHFILDWEIDTHFILDWRLTAFSLMEADTFLVEADWWLTVILI